MGDIAESQPQHLSHRLAGLAAQWLVCSSLLCQFVIVSCVVLWLQVTWSQDVWPHMRGPWYGCATPSCNLPNAGEFNNNATNSVMFALGHRFTLGMLYSVQETVV